MPPNTHDYRAVKKLSWWSFASVTQIVLASGDRPHRVLGLM